MKLRSLFCRCTYSLRGSTLYQITRNGVHLHYKVAYILQCSKCGNIKNSSLDTEVDLKEMTKEEIEEIILLSL